MNDAEAEVFIRMRARDTQGYRYFERQFEDVAIADPLITWQSVAPIRAADLALAKTAHKTKASAPRGCRGDVSFDASATTAPPGAQLARPTGGVKRAPALDDSGRPQKRLCQTIISFAPKK